MTTALKLNSSEWSLEWAVGQYFAASYADGDLISKDWLMWALDITKRGIEENEFLLLERVEAFKQTLLLEHQVALQNVRGRGYRVVPPSEQARYAAEEAARYFEKGVSKAGALLTHTRRSKLTSDEAKRHTDTEIRMASLDGMLSKGKRDVFALFQTS